MTETAFSIPSAPGDVVRGDLRHPAGGKGLPLLLVCHGFTAHKDWGPFPAFGRMLAERGFASAVFNFSHDGVGPGAKRFTELEKFSRGTVADDVRDLRALVEAACAGRIGAHVVDPGRIGVIGHSRGGGVAILCARDQPRIRGVAGWASIATFQRYTARQRETWEREGFLPLTVRGWKTRLRLSVDVLHDLDEGRERYDIAAAVRALRVPLLLVHGEEDLSVKIQEARALHAEADPARARLIVMPHAGHTFGAGHPFRGGGELIDRLVSLTADWFHEFL